VAVNTTPENQRVWQSDPTIYIKIPLFAVDQALSQIDLPCNLFKRDILTVFSPIPRFLSLAIKNLHSLSEISIQVALERMHSLLRNL